MNYFNYIGHLKSEIRMEGVADLIWMKTQISYPTDFKKFFERCKKNILQLSSGSHLFFSCLSPKCLSGLEICEAAIFPFNPDSYLRFWHELCLINYVVSGGHQASL